MNVGALFTGQQGVLIAVQVLWGIAVKHWKPLAAWPNKLIPVFNYALGVLTAIAVDRSTPALAHLLGVGDAYAAATLPGTAGAMLANPFVQSYLATIVSSSHYSWVKNAWQWLRTVLSI